MTTIRSDSASFSVQALGDVPGEESVLISAWVLLGDGLQTKIGADFRLPPEKAIELGKQILKEAHAALIAPELA